MLLVLNVHLRLLLLVKEGFILILSQLARDWGAAALALHGWIPFLGRGNGHVYFSLDGVLWICNKRKTCTASLRETLCVGAAVHVCTCVVLSGWWSPVVCRLCYCCLCCCTHHAAKVPTQSEMYDFPMKGFALCLRNKQDRLSHLFLLKAP